ncbi:MAG: DUF5615 family PIN-like protein [Armatimonadetes bacterium]|nr:DUF5615 family PIN-like protein [Armatimonadota bacterium]
MAKLLFDHNLSPRLVNLLADVYAESRHVFPLGMATSDDKTVWDYAKAHGFVLVSKDSDHADLTVLHGFPPKVIWLRLGNCTTTQIETLLRESADAVASFVGDASVGILQLGGA